MITKVEVYSSLQIATELDLDESGSEIEDDFVQVKDVQGLDPVPASINTMDSASRDGVIDIGDSVPARNIIMILRPNPDWVTWTPEKLRELIYSYFIPKNTVKLIFYSEELGPVTISGRVEACGANPFSKDPEYVVSIICPDPYFESINSITLNGLTRSLDNFSVYKVTVHNGGNVPVGFNVKVPSPGYETDVTIQVGDPLTSSYKIDYTSPDFSYDFEMSSYPGNKFVRLIDPISGGYFSILGGLLGGSTWPLLQPGDNDFLVMTENTDTLGQFWELKYRERFGGI